MSTLTSQRLFDLVRHQRSNLLQDELITEEEYDELCKDHAAVMRLEDYDDMAARLREAKSDVIHYRALFQAQVERFAFLHKKAVAVVTSMGRTEPSWACSGGLLLWDSAVPADNHTYFSRPEMAVDKAMEKDSPTENGLC